MNLNTVLAEVKKNSKNVDRIKKELNSRLNDINFKLDNKVSKSELNKPDNKPEIDFTTIKSHQNKLKIELVELKSEVNLIKKQLSDVIMLMEALAKTLKNR